MVWGPSIKYVTLFLDNFDPPVTLYQTSRNSPKVRHTSRTPRSFLVGLVQKYRTKPPVQILSQLFVGVLSGDLLSGRFCPEWFLSVPPSVRISGVARQLCARGRVMKLAPQPKVIFFKCPYFRLRF